MDEPEESELPAQDTEPAIPDEWTAFELKPTLRTRDRLEDSALEGSDLPGQTEQDHD